MLLRSSRDFLDRVFINIGSDVQGALKHFELPKDAPQGHRRFRHGYVRLLERSLPHFGVGRGCGRFAFHREITVAELTDRRRHIQRRDLELPELLPALPYDTALVYLNGLVGIDFDREAAVEDVAERVAVAGLEQSRLRNLKIAISGVDRSV